MRGKRICNHDGGLSTGPKTIEDKEEDVAEFVVWDGLYDAVLSSGEKLPNGLLKGFLAFTHVEIEIDESESIREFVSNSAKAQERFFRESGT